ncbi:MAG: TPM domain-containing protein [Candidatus Caenarcaniphilales bacterium]|nr:TPM domain-containing protein [Candidatus Caenarcaniphilales bacterium]
MKTTRFFICFALLIVGAVALALPPKSNSLYTNLSKEFPDFLNQSEAKSIESKLADYAINSSNEIAIVVVDDFEGKEVNQYATELFNAWGIGSKKNNNGVLVLVKPTSNDDGGRKVYISTGYGLESVLPDITCKKIISHIITPFFKSGSYYQGLDQATNKIIELSSQEYFQKKLATNQDHKITWVMIVFGVIILLVIMEFFTPKNRAQTIGNNSVDFFPIFLGGFGGGSGGSFGGGFGGGMSGGGGAGGDW